MLTQKFDPIENLDLIRKLTLQEDIVPLHYITTLDESTISIESKQGTATGIGLLKLSEVAVMVLEMTAKTVGTPHIQPEIEYIIVVTGELFQEAAGVITSAKAGEYLIAPPNIPHNHYCIVPTKLVAITVPASEGYPDAR